MQCPVLPYRKPLRKLLATMLATLREGVEIRRYAPRLAAETEVAGTAVEARNAAFRILFAYITGGNAVGEKIAMTAPVAAGRRAETIAMTTPVESAPNAGGVRMRFLPPARYTATTAPRPTDARVRLVPIPDETMAILRFSATAPTRSSRGARQHCARRWRRRRGGRSGSR